MTARKEPKVECKEAENEIEEVIKHLQEIYQTCMSLQYSIDGLGMIGYPLGAQLSNISFHRTVAERILRKLIE